MPNPDQEQRLNFGQVVSTVQRNCHISDARHAGSYSMCSFLLKMREYYRWENDIPLSSRLPSGDVGEWLVEREHAWERLESHAYQPLPIADAEHGPFDDDSVNSVLLEHGYVYNSGVGLYDKPHFYLGDLQRREQRGDIEILVSGCEYARDMVAPPAMVRNGTIFISRESVRRFLWEKIEEAGWRQHSVESPMTRALACYGEYGDIEYLLDDMTVNETESMILHELGEARAGDIFGPAWEEMLAALPRCRAEIIARAVRDNLADCLVTLPTLLEQGNEPALHVYFANFSGMRRALFPEAMAAYLHWIDRRELSTLREAVRSGQERWERRGEQILNIYREAGTSAYEAIENLFAAA